MQELLGALGQKLQNSQNLLCIIQNKERKVKLVIWKNNGLDSIAHQNQAKLISVKNNSNNCNVIGSDIHIL